VTFTLNADGSGRLSISPFAGSGFSVNFPAGMTVFAGSDGPVWAIDNYNNDASEIEFSLTPNGNTLVVTPMVDPAVSYGIVGSDNDGFNSVIFNSGSLTKQG
jgi:hypothetical protein